MLKISPELERLFPGLRTLTVEIENVKVGPATEELKKLSEQIFDEIRGKYDLGSLKDMPTFRAYRDFFWRVGIDPTKSRPAAEALIRRVLAGKPIPSINNLVDAYNLASIKTGIALAAFDLEKLVGELLMRRAAAGEEFLGIGMREPQVLKGEEVVVVDARGIVAIYPYRDAERTKVTSSTERVLLLVCGVPGVEFGELDKARKVAVEFITRFCGGKVKF